MATSVCLASGLSPPVWRSDAPVAERLTGSGSAHSLGVAESGGEIRIGLYVEARDSATGMNEEGREFCASTPGYGTELLPVDLHAPVGSRKVVDLASGEPLDPIG